jgi:LacI family transcriptional regulator
MMEKPKKKIRLKDIADQSGYSITTISHVINKTRKVEEATKNRILSVIQEMGYTPPARRSYTIENKKIGVIISDIRVDYFYEVVRDIEDAAYESGFHMILMDSEENPEKELRCIHSLIAQDVAGIIIAPCDTTADLSFCANFPIVQIDRKLDSDLFDFVGIDNMRSAYSITKKMIRDGFAHIGLLTFSDSNFTARERRYGYRAAMLEQGLYSDDYVLEMQYEAQGFSAADPSQDEIAAYLKQHDDIEALLCCSSNICFQVIGVLSEQLQEHEQIALYSYDDNKWYDYLKYPVNSISQPTTEIATVAVELLEQIIEGRQSSVKKHIMLEYTLKRRIL